MSLSVWCFLLGGLILAEGVSGLVAPQTMTKLFRAFPRNVWAGWILCAIAWIWSGYAMNPLRYNLLCNRLIVWFTPIPPPVPDWRLIVTFA